jgi:uncharacterized membrane protein
MLIDSSNPRKETTMKIKSFATAIIASSLLLTPMLSLAEDAFDKQEDAIENSYDKAKDGCENLKGDAQDTCEAKAKAAYEQQLLTLKKNKQDHEEPANPKPSNS